MSKADLQTVDSSAELELPVQLFAMDGERETLSARIRRVNPGFFQLRIATALAVGRKLVMHYEECRVELAVIYCQRPGLGAYYVGAEVLNQNGTAVRKEMRLPVNIPAKVSVPGYLERVDARILDISSSGLGLILSEEVELGSVITVYTGNGVGFGEVRHCSRTANGRYRSGISLQEFITREEPLSLNERDEGEGSSFLGTLLRKLRDSFSTR